MIALLQELWVFLIFAFLIIRFKIGLAFYLSYIILVPYLNINIGGIQLQWNFVNILVLVITIYHIRFKHKKIKIDYRPFIPFFIYYSFSLILMPFQMATPLGVQFNFWRAEIMSCLILPFALWSQMKIDVSSVKLYRNVTIACIFIVSSYGLFLTAIPGINPYIILVSEANGAEFNEAYALAEGGGRLFGRISSVFAHPMLFGLFLGLSMIYVFYNRRQLPLYVFVILFSIMGLDILFCGVRSAIGGIIIAMTFYFVQSQAYKLMYITIIVGLIGYQVVLTIPDLSAYIGSITDINNQQNDVHGSSIDMRLEQFQGCLKEIQNCFVFGKGFGWIGYYKELHGYHPVILAFESLIYVVLCNSGLIGVIIWGTMSLKLVSYNNMHNKNEKALLNALFAFYIGYSCITGEYGYKRYFLLFYILMLGEILLRQQESPKVCRN